MATAPEQITDPNALDPNEPNQEPGQEPNDGVNDAEPSPYDPLARDMGWVPKDEYKGDPEQWKDAETFIRDGRDIQRDTQRQLKELRSTVETIAKTNGSIVEQEVHRRMDELGGRYSKLVEDGDAAGALKVAGEMHNLVTTSVPQHRAGPPPEAQAFAERNGKWFGKPGYEFETARAIEIGNTLAGQGYTDPGVQLQITERRLKAEFPNLFGQQSGKTQAGVHPPSGRGPSLRSGPKAYADMPDAARKVADDMVSRGVIPDKESYAKNYWLNSEGKA